MGGSILRFSFIIPVYNCEKYLLSCIESILAVHLNENDYEILLIDDGSIDGTAKICDELAEKYSQIHVYHQENEGVSKARNKGIYEAKGEYVLFVDSDDTLLPFNNDVYTYLARGVDMLLFGMKFHYYHDSLYVKEEIMTIDENVEFIQSDIDAYFTYLFTRNYLSPVWNKIFKRSLLTDNQISFDNELTNYEDLAFTLNALSKSKNMVALSEAFYVYRVDYDHDKTVDRIEKINDVIANTDIIAKYFVDLEAICYQGSLESSPMKICLLSIYFHLFSVKMQSVKFTEIKRYCNDFINNYYVNLCIDQVGLQSSFQKKMYKWINNRATVTIWLQTQYFKGRHYIAQNIKRITGWRLR